MPTRSCSASIGLLGPLTRPNWATWWPAARPTGPACARATWCCAPATWTSSTDSSCASGSAPGAGRQDQPRPPGRSERAGRTLDLQVTPDVATDAGRTIGRIGAFVGAPPDMVEVRHGPVDGLWKGAQRTWEVSLLTLRMMGRMVIGEASLKNLSGPLTIADYAGKSASLGLVQYLLFLAMISVSLGVLNLLPLPVLDGGHLMYYLWEAVTGRSVSDAWMERLQRGGVAVLLVMMSIALFNDVTRLFG
jgi:regulator of sigma E protease